MKKVALLLLLIIIVVLAGVGFAIYRFILVNQTDSSSEKTEKGVKIVELKKLPGEVKVNFKVGDSCEKPGKGRAIKFSMQNLLSANVKAIEYEFKYVDENKGSIQGNGTTMPVEVTKDTYEPMTANCNEYGLFSCSAGGTCVYYKVSKIDATYKFHFKNGEIGELKASYTAE